MDARRAFARLHAEDARLSEVEKLFNLTGQEIGLALHYAQLSKTISTARGFTIAPPPVPSPPVDKEWCLQCERLVFHAEADACRSRWCKARKVRRDERLTATSLGDTAMAGA